MLETERRAAAALSPRACSSCGAECPSEWGCGGVALLELDVVDEGETLGVLRVASTTSRPRLHVCDHASSSS